jgi:hypothetical protein
MSNTIVFTSDFKTNEILKEKGFLTGKKGKQASNLSEYIRGLIQKDQSMNNLLDLQMANTEQEIKQIELEQLEKNTRLEKLKTNLLEMKFVKNKVEKRKLKIKALNISEVEFNFLEEARTKLARSNLSLLVQKNLVDNYNETFNKKIDRQEFNRLLKNL